MRGSRAIRPALGHEIDGRRELGAAAQAALQAQVAHYHAHQVHGHRLDADAQQEDLAPLAHQRDRVAEGRGCPGADVDHIRPLALGKPGQRQAQVFLCGIDDEGRA